MGFRTTFGPSFLLTASATICSTMESSFFTHPLYPRLFMRLLMEEHAHPGVSLNPSFVKSVVRASPGLIFFLDIVCASRSSQVSQSDNRTSFESEYLQNLFPCSSKSAPEYWQSIMSRPPGQCAQCTVLFWSVSPCGFHRHATATRFCTQMDFDYEKSSGSGS